MRKWGLHYLLYLVVVAVVLTGCGASSSNSDSAANTESAFRNEAASDGSAESAPAAVEVKEDSLANTAMAVNDQAAVKGGGGNSAVPGAGAEQGTDASAGFTGTDVVAGLNKKLIYKANLNMEVSDYGAAQTEVRNMVTLAGGYIIEFSENMSEYEQGGTFILKVPAAGFSPFLNNLEKIKHEKLQRSIQGQDVSEEYVDLESRLKAKQMMEAQYIDFMKKATKPADLVQFANQLGEIQEQIEQIKGRMRYIDQNVSFSTVELRLYQTEKSLTLTQTNSEGPLGERASEALKSSMKALSVMFQWLVVVLAAALPVLLVAGVVVALVLWLRKSFKRRQPAHPEQARLGGNRLPGRESQPQPEVAPVVSAAADEENTDKQNK
ncbi:DUF4349 domain-containing protein [Paenibacillus sp. FSL R7-0333]|uniref:DUF4349 domain-containing protein n=1 Tax=Paenibacillus sp. FSL R7-0333 TaxID=1926587 RepID=UPI00096EE130|nr:hypothetical protein BK146_17485 [Paenibacillus sp. FSL R7-0333]